MVNSMLNKLLSLFRLPKEYGSELKIEVIGEDVLIINYNNLLEYSENEIILLKLIIRGEELRLIYQDPKIIKIKGKVKEIIKGDNTNDISSNFRL